MHLQILGCLCSFVEAELCHIEDNGSTGRRLESYTNFLQVGCQH